MNNIRVNDIVVHNGNSSIWYVHDMNSQANYMLVENLFHDCDGIFASRWVPIMDYSRVNRYRKGDEVMDYSGWKTIKRVIDITLSTTGEVLYCVESKSGGQQLFYENEIILVNYNTGITWGDYPENIFKKNPSTYRQSCKHPNASNVPKTDNNICEGDYVRVKHNWEDIVSKESWWDSVGAMDWKAFWKKYTGAVVDVDYLHTDNTGEHYHIKDDYIHALYPEMVEKVSDYEPWFAPSWIR